MGKQVGHGQGDFACPFAIPDCDLRRVELVCDRPDLAAPLTGRIAGLSGPKTVLSRRAAIPDLVITSGPAFLLVRRYHAVSALGATAAGPLARLRLRRFCAIALKVWPQPASVAEMPVDFCQRRIAASTAA
jgi:hypothetical protein